MIPFDAIRDDGIVTVSDRSYEGIEDFHDETARRAQSYRLNRQAGQRHYIELWCEAAGMLHQLKRVGDDYSVKPYSNGRFTSLTAIYEIADRALARDVPTILLHVGDYDPSGESMFEAMAEDAAAFVEADWVIRTQRIEAVRVALTSAQIAFHKLPTAPPKKSDSRSKKWEAEGKGGTCQLEALPPDILAQVVREAIEDHLDLDLWRRRVEAEGADRAELLGLPPGEAG